MQAQNLINAVRSNPAQYYQSNPTLYNLAMTNNINEIMKLIEQSNIARMNQYANMDSEEVQKKI